MSRALCPKIPSYRENLLFYCSSTKISPLAETKNRPRTHRSKVYVPYHKDYYGCRMLEKLLRLDLQKRDQKPAANPKIFSSLGIK